MAPKQFKRVGTRWDKAALGFYFGSNDDRADFSVVDTLRPMLDKDHRVLNDEIWFKLLQWTNPDRLAGVVAGAIHKAYILSKPAG